MKRQLKCRAIKLFIGKRYLSSEVEYTSVALHNQKRKTNMCTAVSYFFEAGSNSNPDFTRQLRYARNAKRSVAAISSQIEDEAEQQ